MHRGPRLIRRFPVAMSDAAWRRLDRFATESGLSRDEALTFVFENLGSIADAEALPHRLRLFKADLPDRQT